MGDASGTQRWTSATIVCGAITAKSQSDEPTKREDAVADVCREAPRLVVHRAPERIPSGEQREQHQRHADRRRRRQEHEHTMQIAVICAMRCMREWSSSGSVGSSSDRTSWRPLHHA